MISDVSIRIKQLNCLRSPITRNAYAEIKCHARVIHRLFSLSKVSLAAYMSPENFDLDENVQMHDFAEYSSSKTVKRPLMLVMSG